MHAAPAESMARTDFMPATDINKTPTIGWREWAALPQLGIPAVKVKVDTGARTSALHAYRIEPFEQDGREHIRFWIHPLQRRTDIVIACEAPLLDRRMVRDSGGHAEERYVISTPLRIGKHEWDIELTLTSREDMLFRMLLGRRALIAGHFLVDPRASYLNGKKPKHVYAPRKHKEAHK